MMILLFGSKVQLVVGHHSVDLRRVDESDAWPRRKNSTDHRVYDANTRNTQPIGIQYVTYALW